MNLNYSHIYTVLKPLLYFLIGIVIYGVFVFKFYRYLGSKDIIKLNLNDRYNRLENDSIRNFFGVFFYLIEYLLFLPIIIFFWFIILVVLLTLLSKNQDLSIIILIAISVVGAIRVTSYYNEDLSRDLAKMLPFALLGVYLIDISYVSFYDSIEILKDLVGYKVDLLYNLGFIIILEFILRIFYLIKTTLFPPKFEELEED